MHRFTTYSPHIKQRPTRPFPLTLHAVNQLIQPGNFIDGEYTISLVSKVITPENKAGLLAKLRGASRSDVEKLLASMQGIQERKKTRAH